MHFDRFNDLPLDPAVGRYPGWTSATERAFNRWFASEAYTGRGEIVDLGCMTGSSTVSLASGLASNPRANGRRIHAYDRFIKSWPTIPGEPLEGTPQGGDFFPRFVAETAPWSAFIDVHRGDLETVTWPDAPIEYLLVDLMKSWDTARMVAEKFFPPLLDRDALVVHQDFIFFHTPWIHLLMFRLRGMLAPAFEVPDSCTMVFQTNGHIGPEACRRATDFDGVTEEEVEEAFAWSEGLVTKNSKAPIHAARAMFFCTYAQRARSLASDAAVRKRWMRRSIDALDAIEPRFHPHRDVVRARAFIEQACGVAPPVAPAAATASQSLRLVTVGECDATLTTPAEGATRVAIAKTCGGPAWHIQLVGQPIPVTNGDGYRVKFRARADAPRKIVVLAVDGHRSAPLGLAREIELDSAWKEVLFDFIASGDDDAARLRFNLGAADTAVEITDVSFAPIR